jgi:hypothetical protein
MTYIICIDENKNKIIDLIEKCYLYNVNIKLVMTSHYKVESYDILGYNLDDLYNKINNTYCTKYSGLQEYFKSINDIDEIIFIEDKYPYCACYKDMFYDVKNKHRIHIIISNVIGDGQMKELQMYKEQEGIDYVVLTTLNDKYINDLLKFNNKNIIKSDKSDIYAYYGTMINKLMSGKKNNNSLNDKCITYHNIKKEIKGNYLKHKINIYMKYIISSVATKNDGIVDSIISFSKKYKESTDRYEKLFIKRCIDNISLLNSLKHNKNNFDDEYDSDDEELIESKDFYSSFFSLTNWFDECISNGSMGLLVNINASVLGKIGIDYGVTFGDISNNFLPIEDYLCTLLESYKDNNFIQNGDLNNKNVINTGTGGYNCIVPLYINKDHWKTTQKYIPFVLGIAMSHNPLGYHINYHRMLFSFLLHFTKEMVYNEKYQNIKSMKIYMSYLRTCMEICIDKGYNRGIYKLLQCMEKDPTKRVTKFIDGYKYILGQILCIRGKKNKGLLNIVEYMLEEIIRHNMKNINKKDMSSHIKDKNIIEILSNMKNLYDHIEIILGFYSMFDALEELYKKIGSYNKFIQYMEQCYSVFSDKNIEWFLNVLKQKTINIKSITQYYKYKNKCMNSIYYEEMQIKRLSLYIIQGYIHRNNKIRYREIENGSYNDLNLKDISIDEIYKLYDIGAV